MNSREKKLNFYYACLQGMYWASWCTIIYTQTFMLGRGFTNGQIGIGLAVSGLANFALTNFFGYAVDKWEKISAFTLITASSATIILCALALIIFKTTGWPAAIMFLVCNVACQAMNSMYTKLFVDAKHRGANINYAKARKIGSITYAVIALVFGRAITAVGSDVVPVIGLILCVLQFVFAYLTHKTIEEYAADQSVEIKETKSGKGYGAFIRENKKYAILLLGIAIVFPAYGAMSNFMLSIVQNLGGDASTLGYITSYQAVIEILAMIYYQRKKNKNISQLLKLSIIVYPLRIFLTAMVPNMTTLFVVVSLHVLTYGLYTPAIIEYVNKVVPYEDSAKAQSLSASVSCIGTFIVSMFSGYMFDSMEPKKVLLILAAVAVFGLVFCLMGIENTGVEEE